MPIYAYKCESCGYAKDTLQKMSDAPLTVCPQCSASSFKKQLTAAGFQLKGSGWYVTDFRSGNNGAPAQKAEDAQAGAPGNADIKSADSAVAAAPAGVSTTTPAAPAPKAAPAAPSGGKSKSTSGDASSKSS